MKLPYRNRAFIPPEKINNYLLSLTHEDGKHKAIRFRKLGFSEANTSLFENALLKIAHANDVDSTSDMVDKKTGKYFGKKYVIIGSIIGPNETINIKTVWGILENQRKPYLITSNPFI